MAAEDFENYYQCGIGFDIKKSFSGHVREVSRVILADPRREEQDIINLLHDLWRACYEIANIRPPIGLDWIHLSLRCCRPENEDLLGGLISS